MLSNYIEQLCGCVRGGRPPGVIVQRLFTSVRMFDPSAYS